MECYVRFGAFSSYTHTDVYILCVMCQSDEVLHACLYGTLEEANYIFDR